MYERTHLKKPTLPHYTCSHNAYVYEDSQDTPTNVPTVLQQTLNIDTGKDTYNVHNPHVRNSPHPSINAVNWSDR